MTLTPPLSVDLVNALLEEHREWNFGKPGMLCHKCQTPYPCPTRRAIEVLQGEHERAERYEAGLRGEVQQLHERAVLAEAKVQDLTAVAAGAGNAVSRLKAQVASLLTTLTQDEFPDPAILHAECREEIDRLKQARLDGAAPGETCAGCKHAWRWHTQGGMCQGTAEGIECHCSFMPPVNDNAQQEGVEG